MNRIDEILNSISAFNKSTYSKDELLPELLQLQKEVVDLTFNEEHAEKTDLRLWDVKNHFITLNNSRCGVADKELNEFMEKNGAICNLIAGEISGRKGENRVFRNLEICRTNPVALKNVEFLSDEIRTEVDAIAITERAVFILEIKNTGNNIHIDEAGNYFRVKEEHVTFDCNIGEKMNCREYLVNKCMKKVGMENINIINMIVFTNSSIKVANEYKYIDYCFLSQMAHLIDEYKGEIIYSRSDMEAIAKTISDEEQKGEYAPIDAIEQFKHSFAALMAALEENALEEVRTRSNKVNQKSKGLFLPLLKELFLPRQYQK